MVKRLFEGDGGLEHSEWVQQYKKVKMDRLHKAWQFIIIERKVE